MRKFQGKIVGILGTVILHLIAGIIFMTFQLHTLKVKQEKVQKFELEMVDEEELKPREVPKEIPMTSIENIFHDDAEMLNIARNLANRSDVKIDRDAYIDKVKEELIQSGKLGMDNYIDNPESGSQSTENEFLNDETDEAERLRKEEEELKESQKMAANYAGPTRIYYDLAGRNHVFLPIPIYKCQGSGKVVLIIDVDQKGNVSSASIVEEESTTAEECLIETAISSARRSRFSADFNAPRSQRGTLTYIFVAQ